MRNEKLKDCLDDALSGIQENPWLYQQVLHRAEREENTQMKKKLSFSFVSVIAILLILGAVAYAATEVYHRISVNWKGETIEEEPWPEITTAPPEIMTEAELSLMASDLLHHSVAEEEYGIVSYTTSYGTPGTSKPISKTYNSWDEFQDAMANTDSLTLPAWVPDGYEFESATLWFGCRKDGEYKLIEEYQDGIMTVERYKVDDTDLVIIGYDITYRESDEAYHYIGVSSRLDEETDGEDLFGVNEEESATVVTIPGMDDAILISSSNEIKMSRLVMQRELGSSVECEPEPAYTKAPGPIDSTIYIKERISVFAPMLDAEDLQKVFASE